LQSSRRCKCQERVCVSVPARFRIGKGGPGRQSCFCFWAFVSAIPSPQPRPSPGACTRTRGKRGHDLPDSPRKNRPREPVHTSPRDSSALPHHSKIQRTRPNWDPYNAAKKRKSHPVFVLGSQCLLVSGYKTSHGLSADRSGPTPEPKNGRG